MKPTKQEAGHFYGREKLTLELYMSRCSTLFHSFCRSFSGIPPFLTEVYCFCRVKVVVVLTQSCAATEVVNSDWLLFFLLWLSLADWGSWEHWLETQTLVTSWRHHDDTLCSEWPSASRDSDAVMTPDDWWWGNLQQLKHSWYLSREQGKLPWHVWASEQGIYNTNFTGQKPRSQCLMCEDRILSAHWKW